MHSSATDGRPDVSVITVTYNSKTHMQRCLPALRDAMGAVPFELVVVDNASADGTPEEVLRLWPEARLVRNDGNRGFSAANNQGAAKSRGRFLLFLNPDTVPEPNSIAVLAEWLQEHDSIGLVGPRLIYPDGRLQHSLRNFPSPGNQFFEALFLHRALPRMTDRLGEVITDSRAYGSARDVDWISGAVMLARREAFDAVGGFDERYFLYSDELDLCRCMTSAKWGVAFVPSATVVHHHGDTTRPELFRLQLRSRMLYFEKHATGSRLHSLKAATALGLAVRVPLLAVRQLAGDPASSERRASHADGLRMVLSGTSRGGQRT
jgi:N-acetylglucosaminyl-diphospho-decaprenol L-rhamnosyltransferase